jgi:hypothetical protein
VPGKRNSAQHMKMKAVAYYYQVIEGQVESYIVDRDMWRMYLKDVTQFLINSETMTSKLVRDACYVIDWYTLHRLGSVVG